jgi:uncharacterized membrane protein YcaP (DUF421 family)
MTINDILGEGTDLDTFQMSLRGIIIFFAALALIRIAGRRSFGVHSPLDNIISISLGAVLSRAIVGASPFIPVLITCLVIVILHRFLAWLEVHHKKLRMIEGEKILLYKDGDYIQKHMDRALISEEDVLQGIRETASTDDLNKIDKVYMERNGQISAIKKDPD